MAKHTHSIKYSALHLQITGILFFVLFYFVPLTAMVIFGRYYFFPEGLPTLNDTAGLMLAPVYLFVCYYLMLVLHILMVGIAYRLVPMPAIGRRVPTYSTDWLFWGIKAEIWKLTSDLPIFFSFVLKAYSLRWLMFKMVGLKIDNTSIIVTDVRIYDPHLLEVGKNVLLPVYSIFSGHIITGNTMYMDKIRLGDNVSIGARSGFAPGVTIGNNVTLGFGTLIGLKVSVGNNTIVDSRSALSDNAIIGSNVFIGKDCVLGRKVIIGDNIRIPDYSKIPSKAIIRTKADLLRYIKPTGTFNNNEQAGLPALKKTNKSATIVKKGRASAISTNKKTSTRKRKPKNKTAMKRKIAARR